jgi:hypothetical protein
MQLRKIIVILSIIWNICNATCRMTIDGVWIGEYICRHLIHIILDYRQYSAISELHILQFTVTHAIGSPVFSSRILATDLSQSHCNFKSHVKSFCHSLITFFPFLQLPIPKTRLSSSRLLSTTVVKSVPSSDCALYKPSARTPRKTQFSIVNDACLRVRYLAMDVLLLHTYASRECVHRVVA